MEETAERFAARAVRERGIKCAVASSLVSKAMTLSVQFFAMPVAFRSLGTEAFALFSMLVAGSTWLALTNLGMGPAVVTRIAASNAAKDRAEQARVLTSAFVPVLSLAAIVVSALVVATMFLPAETIVGRKLAAFGVVAAQGFALLVIIGGVQAVVSVIESVQTGFQEQYILNLWVAAGGALSVPWLLASARWHPTVLAVLIAVNIPPLAARIANSLLVLIRRPYLVPQFRYFDWTRARSLAIDGAAFALVGVGSFLNHHFSIVLAARTMPADVTSTLAATMAGFLLCFGLVSMVAIPLWPATADSAARGETGWVTIAFRRTRNFAFLYGAMVAATFLVAGDKIFQSLYGQGFRPTVGLMLAAGCYFLAAMWEYVHYSFLIGLSRVVEASLLYLLRSVVMAVLMPFALASYQGAGVFLAGTVSCLAITAVSYPLLTRRRLMAMSISAVPANAI